MYYEHVCIPTEAETSLGYIQVQSKYKTIPALKNF